MGKVKKLLNDYLHWFIVGGVVLLCAIFLIAGHASQNGNYVTLDGSDAQISEGTKEWIESANEAMNRIMNESKPTDETTEDAHNEDQVGLGFYTTIEEVLGRMLQDGNNDNGLGWQCSRYTGWLGTGQWSYSSAHPDYGPRNGKDMAQWLVDNYGYKYIDQPVRGAIGSGGFNTLYGHTALYLYSTGANTAMVQDANYVPLTVSTHNMNIEGWVWVVPGSYNPEPEPTPPTPTPIPTPTPTSEPVTLVGPKSGDVIEYTYVYGDYFSKVLVNLGLDENHLWGEGGTVQYYTNQLIQQDMLDYRGNVYVGVPFKLTVR